jgi:hypothetical protein
MSTKTMRLDELINSGTPQSTTTAGFVCASTPVSFSETRYVTLHINRILSDQSYYWSDAWQAGEIASRAALEAGEYQTFDDPAEAISWLQADDNEDD